MGLSKKTAYNITMSQDNNRIIGNTLVVETLQQMANSGQIAHSILLAGSEKIGRTTIALQFAAMLNCKDADSSKKPCGHCRTCRLIISKKHPDVIHLVPGNVLCRGEGGHESHPNSRDIRICQIRGVIETVSRYPFEAPWRVIIIEPAEHLGRESANALLKTLEEPPEHTVFILISATPHSLPETIVSRCRQLTCSLVSPKIIEQELLLRSIPPEVASKATKAANKRPGEAIKFSQYPDLIETRIMKLENCKNIINSGNNDRFQYASELANNWRKDRSMVYEELEIWSSFWEENLLKAARSENLMNPAIHASLTGLKAVDNAKNNLDALVMPRLCLELMLLQFPVLK